jgi:hypothetical protein
MREAAKASNLNSRHALHVVDLRFWALAERLWRV